MEEGNDLRTLTPLSGTPDQLVVSTPFWLHTMSPRGGPSHLRVCGRSVPEIDINHPLADDGASQSPPHLALELVEPSHGWIFLGLSVNARCQPFGTNKG